VKKVLSPQRIIELQDLVRRVPAAEHVIRFAVRLVRASRPRHASATEFAKKWVNWGAGPRASQYLILGAKARAVLRGRYAASCEDIRAIAPPILQHRIIPNFHAEAEGITSLKVIEQLLGSVRESD
jgi:MoxR-like ATPase